MQDLIQQEWYQGDFQGLFKNRYPQCNILWQRLHSDHCRPQLSSSFLDEKDVASAFLNTPLAESKELVSVEAPKETQ